MTPFVKCLIEMCLTEVPDRDSLASHAELAARRQPLIFDGRNLFDPVFVREEGMEYYGVGRAQPSCQPQLDRCPRSPRRGHLKAVRPRRKAQGQPIAGRSAGPLNTFRCCC